MTQYASKYLIGRPFKTSHGMHHAGELAPREAATWFGLDSLVASGHLYPYVPEDDYKHLPPHVFNAVRTRQEAEGLIKVGERPIAMNWDEPSIITEAQRVVDAEREGKQKNLKIQIERIDEREEEPRTTPTLPARPVIGSTEQPVPGEVDDKLSEAAAAADEDYEDYEGYTKADLLAEIDRRNANREESKKISKDGNKPDLTERLRNDDNEQDQSIVTDDDESNDAETPGDVVLGEDKNQH